MFDKVLTVNKSYFFKIVQKYKSYYFNRLLYNIIFIGAMSANVLKYL